MKKGTLFLLIVGAIVIFGAGVLFGIYCDKKTLQELSDTVSPQQSEAAAAEQMNIGEKPAEGN